MYCSPSPTRLTHNHRYQRMTIKFFSFAFIRQLRQDRRDHGWKGMLKKHGWKPFALFVVFYLVRDLILYVFIPAAIYFGIKGGG